MKRKPGLERRAQWLVLDETDAGLHLIKVRLHHIQWTAIRGKRLKNLPRILLVRLHSRW